MNKTNVQSWKEIEGVYAALTAGLRLQSNFGSLPATYTIRADSTNRVTVQRTGSTAVTLSPADKDLLFDPSNPFTGWKIERNAAGEVEGIRFTQHLPGTGPERFNKKISGTIPAKPVPVKMDSAGLVKYTGTYAHEFGDRSSIIIEKGALFMEDQNTGVKTQLHWISGNTFWVKERDTQVVFDANSKGTILGAKYFNGFREIVMRRIEEIY